MTTAKDMILALIAERAVATVEDVAAAIATHPQMNIDEDTLKALANAKGFDDLSLVDVYGSIRVHGFRPDWSCTASGYGYTNAIGDFRKGIRGPCAPADHKYYLAKRVNR